MKNPKTVLLFDEWLEQIIIHYGDEDVKRKLESVKNFLKENFQIEEFDNSYIQIKRLHSKSFMWLLLSFIIDYETMKQNQKEQSLKFCVLGDITSQKLKIAKEKTEKQKHFLSLEVEDIFPIDYMTLEEVEFIKHCLEKINVDIETEDDEEFILNGRQFLFLLMGIMKEYSIFFGNSKKIED
jgi:hypothetical protein